MEESIGGRTALGNKEIEARWRKGESQIGNNGMKR
jgi:hypothetical protein